MTAYITPERIAELLALYGYTPGPWKHVINRDGTVNVVSAPDADGDTSKVALCNRPYGQVHGQFIAAAPELHAALAQVNAENERLRVALCRLTNEVELGDRGVLHGVPEAIRFARAALNPEGEA